VSVDFARERLSAAHTQVGAAWNQYVHARTRGDALNALAAEFDLEEAHLALAKAEMRLWDAMQEDNG
jgi:hypothetical protein